MGKDPIQNDADATLPGLGAKGLEVLLRTQQGVDALVVRCVVAVVAVRLEDGIEIDAGDAQLLQIRELLPDAVEVAAVIVVRGVVPAAAVGGIEGLLRPILMQVHLPPHALMVGGPGGHGRVLAAAKPIGKYLIGHGPAEPGGGLELGGIDGDLPELSPILPQLAPAGPAAVVPIPAVLPDQEPVEHEARLVHGPKAHHEPLRPRGPQGHQPLPRPILQQQEHLAVDVGGPDG